MAKLASRLKQKHTQLSGSSLQRQEAERLYPLVKMVWKSVHFRQAKSSTMAS